MEEKDIKNLIKKVHLSELTKKIIQGLGVQLVILTTISLQLEPTSTKVVVLEDNLVKLSTKAKNHKPLVSVAAEVKSY
jgi:hypothetical protein